jgi:hypothetical protein
MAPGRDDTGAAAMLPWQQHISSAPPGAATLAAMTGSRAAGIAGAVR